MTSSEYVRDYLVNNHLLGDGIVPLANAPTRSTLVLENPEWSRAKVIRCSPSRDYREYGEDLYGEEYTDRLIGSGYWTKTMEFYQGTDFGIFFLCPAPPTMNGEPTFIVVPSGILTERLQRIRKKAPQTRYDIYFWFTVTGKCWEARGLRRIDHDAIIRGTFRQDERNFTPFLNNWQPLSAPRT